MSRNASAERAAPAELTDPEAWYCEVHPEYLMGHDGCGGAGVLGIARIGQLVRQRDWAEQRAREAYAFRDDVVAQIKLAEGKKE